MYSYTMSDKTMNVHLRQTHLAASKNDVVSTLKIRIHSQLQGAKSQNYEILALVLLTKPFFAGIEVNQ